MKPTATSKGRLAEQWVKDILLKKGFTFEAANLRTKAGELDLVMWEEKTLVFIEVKARSRNHYGRPEEAVDFPKQRRLINAASAYLATLKGTLPVCRFDVAAVTMINNVPSDLRLIKDAFRPGE